MIDGRGRRESRAGTIEQRSRAGRCMVVAAAAFRKLGIEEGFKGILWAMPMTTKEERAP
jgi:hypothetical protein